MKFTTDDREALRAIIEGEPESPERQQKIREYLLEMKKNTKGYQQQKEFKKITALYDTHDFWES